MVFANKHQLKEKWHEMQNYTSVKGELVKRTINELFNSARTFKNNLVISEKQHSILTEI